MNRHLGALVPFLTTLAMLLAGAPGRADELGWPAPKLQKGTDQGVTVENLHRELRLLPESERPEAVRDLILAAAFSSLEPDSAHAAAFAATFAPLRRTYLAGLADMQVGPGRSAFLRPGELLVVVPASGDKPDAFAWPLLCRLLDRQVLRTGHSPKRVHLVTYRGDGSDGDAPDPAFRYVGPLAGEDFYTPGGRYGFSRRTVQGEKDLRSFLEETNDLLAAEVTAAGELVLSGRKYPEHRPAEVKKPPKKDAETPFLRPWAPLGWDDLRVLRRAFSGAAGDRELGFSLDPWLQGDKLAKELLKILDEDQDRPAAEALPKKQRDALRETAEAFADWRAFPSPDSIDQRQVAQDFMVALAELDQAARKRLNKKEPSDADETFADTVARLRDARQRYEFTVARYEGGTKGTRVGMCQYYTDDMAKVIAFGQLRSGEEVSPVKGIPTVAGFVPASRLQLAAFYSREELTAAQVRLWWGSDVTGVRWDGDTAQSLHFAPVAVELFMLSNDPREPRAKAPGVMWETFTRSWNARYLEIADQEPQYHLLNQINKYAFLLKWLKENDHFGLLAMLDKGDAPEDKWRYDKWYEQAKKDGLVGIDIKVVPTRRAIGEVPAEATENWDSGPYRQAGKEFGWSGGYSGPTAAEVRSAKRGPADPVQFDKEVLLAGKATLRLRQSGPARLTPESLEALRGPLGRLSLPQPLLEVTTERGADGRVETRNYLPLAAAEQSPMLAVGNLVIQPGAGDVRVVFHPGAFDLGYQAIARLAAEGRLGKDQFDEMLYAKDGSRLYLRLKGMKDGWLELAAGGGKKPPRDPGTGFILGNPDEPTGWYGNFRSARELIPDDLVAAARPRFAVFQFTDWGGQWQQRWLKGPSEATWEFVNGLGTLHLDAAGRLIAEGKVADLLGKLTPEAAERLQAALEPQSQTTEIALDLAEKKVFLSRDHDRWTLRDQPSVNDILAADSLILAVATSDGSTVRFRDGDLLLPKDWTPQQRRLVGRQVVSLIGNDAELYSRLTRSPDGVDVAALRQLAQLRTPTRLKLTLAGKDAFRLADGADEITDTDLSKPELAQAWKDRLGKPLVVDISALVDTGNQRLFQSIMEKLAKVSKKHGQVLLVDAGVEGSEQRLRQVAAGGQLTVAPVTRGLEKKPQWWLRESVNRWLQRRNAEQEFAPNTVVRIEHFVKGSTEPTILEEVKNGVFQGKHLVFVACNDNASFFHDLAKQAVDPQIGGARSVTIQVGKVDVAGGVLTMEGFLHNPTFPRWRPGMLPSELWARGEQVTVTLLKTCDPLHHSTDPVWAEVKKAFPNLKAEGGPVSDADATAVREKFPQLEKYPLSDREVEQALREAYPKFQDAARLFHSGGETDGHFERSLLFRTIQKLEQQYRFWLDIVIRTEGDGPDLDRQVDGARIRAA